MMTRKTFFLVLVSLILLLLMSGTVSASLPKAAIGTGFTYQGRLTIGGAPAEGTYDFLFSLFNDNISGSQVGSTVTKEAVLVSEGLFMVQLDFGAVFDGTMYYLEVRVRPSGSDDAYTTLSPRQALTAAPYALSAPWSGLTGIPAGFADGVDDDTTYTAGDGLELTGTQFKGKGTAYQNVVIVAKSGGDFTSIQAALDSIVDADEGNPYLVYVAPGVYNERVTMKTYVDIEGSGELTTRITFAGSDSSYIGTVMGADNAELRFLTVESTGGDNFATAIYNISASPRLSHITIIASGGTYNYGVFNNYFSSPMMTDMKVSASGWGESSCYGVLNVDSSSPIMTNVIATATGGNWNYGVMNASSSPVMTDVTANAWIGENNYAVYNDSSSPTLTNVTASASGGTENYGIYNAATGGPYTIFVNNSQISGGTNSVHNDAGVNVYIGASQLSGGPVYPGSGTVTCVYVYDKNYASYTCP